MMYPTEDDYQQERTVAPRTGGVSDAEVAEAEARLASLRESCNQRIRSALQDDSYDCSSIPSLQELRAEREHLVGTVRHHKDEQDSLALDIEGQDGATEVYQIASRVSRFERFAKRSDGYVDEALRGEVDQVIAADKHQSEAEIAAFIDELQTKRAAVTKKLEAAQARPNKAATSRHIDSSVVEVDEAAQKSLEHAAENVKNAQTLSEKVKTFRALKTKLLETIATEDRNEEKAVVSRRARLKNAELANARDTRQVRELNARNAALTTNTQMLLSQLNTLHYGIDNAPTAQQMLEERKRREVSPEATPRNNNRGDSPVSIGSRHSQGSRQASLSKPPLVASKPTVSQRNRDEALRSEREEASASRRRTSEAGSIYSQGSRQPSLSKPPLVASKPTVSQRNRDEALRSEREEASASRRRMSELSMSSEIRPPSVTA